MRKSMTTTLTLAALFAAAPVLAVDVTAPNEAGAEAPGVAPQIEGILSDRSVRNIRELPLEARRLGIVDLDTGIIYSNLGDAQPAGAVDVTAPDEAGAEELGAAPQIEGILNREEPAGRAVNEQTVPSVMAPNEQVQRDSQPDAESGLTGTDEAVLPEGVSPMIIPGEGPGVEAEAEAD